MTDLELFLDHWMIRRNDGSYALNGKYEEFVKNLELQIELDKVRLIDEAAQAVSMLKINITDNNKVIGTLDDIITGR